MLETMITEPSLRLAICGSTRLHNHFGQPAEIVVLDLTTARSKAPTTVLFRPQSAEKQQVVEKPVGSFSASIALDSNTGTFYVTDAGNGLVKSFALADILNAYNTATPLDWNTDGTSIGSAFQYPLGGVSGFTASGNLVMGGFGSIVEVDPSGPTTVTTLDHSCDLVEPYSE